jgi:hypothetical protein
MLVILCPSERLFAPSEASVCPAFRPSIPRPSLGCGADEKVVTNIVACVHNEAWIKEGLAHQQ